MNVAITGEKMRATEPYRWRHPLPFVISMQRLVKAQQRNNWGGQSQTEQETPL